MQEFLDSWLQNMQKEKLLNDKTTSSYKGQYLTRKREDFNMKEKTFKDLGLDEGDKYLNKISLEYDLGELGDLNEMLEQNNNEKIEEDKIKNIKDNVQKCIN